MSHSRPGDRLGPARDLEKEPDIILLCLLQISGDRTMINGEGFYKGHDFTWDVNELTIYQKSIYSVLHRWAKGSTGIIKMSKKQIGLAAGIKSRKTVRKALEALEKMEVEIAGKVYPVLEIIPLNINGKDLCTEYILPPFHERGSVKFGHKPPKRDKELGGHEIPPSDNRGAPDTPLSREPHTPLRGAPDTPTGQQGQHRTTIPEGDGVMDVITKLKELGVNGPEAKRLYMKYGPDRCRHNIGFYKEAQETADRHDFKTLKLKKPGPGLLVTAIREDYCTDRWVGFIESLEKKAEKKRTGGNEDDPVTEKPAFRIWKTKKEGMFYENDYMMGNGAGKYSTWWIQKSHSMTVYINAGKIRGIEDLKNPHKEHTITTTAEYRAEHTGTAIFKHGRLEGIKEI